MRIALIDDDETALDFVTSVLATRNYRHVVFRNSRDLLAALMRDTFDLLIVDWNLPEIDGLEIVRWVRNHLADRPGILMLTARNNGDDVVTALEAGADDYIVKPETAKITAARIDAILRRTVRGTKNEEAVFGRYVFDLRTRNVTFDGRAVVLTPKEYDLALRLFERRDRPLSRAYLLELVWHNAGSLSTRTLDMHVSRLRSKLFLKPEHGFRLATVFGHGYRLETCTEWTSEADGRSA